MSGIIAKLSFEPDEPLARPMLEQMLEAVSHRGGSARHIYIAPGVAVASTIDIAVRGPIHVAADADLVDAAQIATAYSEHGERCFASLDGAFACIIWDSFERRLLLARDHVGRKPLHFAFLHGHGVVAASELKALFTDPGVTREHSPPAIDAYLTLGYIPAPMSAFNRVSKVEPAQFIAVEGRRLRAQRYWAPPQSVRTMSRDEAIRQVDTSLRMATRRQELTSDATVLMSGGLGSTALLASMPKAQRPVVTVALDQPSSELARTHAAAQQLGYLTEIEVTPLDAPALVSGLAACSDEPVADPSALIQYALFGALRGRTDSAVGGHGAHALFGAPRQHTVWDEADRRAIYTRSFAWKVRDADPRALFRDLSQERAGAPARERSRHVELRSALPDCVIAVAERASFSAGITVQYPWLDRHLVELAATLPALPAPGAESASVLRHLLTQTLPLHLLPAGGAIGVPQWLRATLATMVPSFLLASRFDARGIVSRPVLRQLWEQHSAGRADHTLHFWSLLMLELWFREFIDDDAAEAPLEYAVLKAA